MGAIIIDGKIAASDLKASMKAEVDQRKENNLPVPGLATVLVGSDPASQSYVRAKHRACDALGIRSVPIDLPAEISQEELELKIKELADDDPIHACLVRLSPPK